MITCLYKFMHITLVNYYNITKCNADANYNIHDAPDSVISGNEIEMYILMINTINVSDYF